MIKYKNISYSAKTFYGVTFEPGETKEVPGYINNQGMVRVFGIKPTPKKTLMFEIPTPTSSRGRKKKSNEPEKVSNAETETIITKTPEEETTNGYSS